MMNEFLEGPCIEADMSATVVAGGAVPAGIVGGVVVVR